MYGRNLHENQSELLRQVLQTCRTQLRKKQSVRTVKDLSQEEIDQILSDRCGEYLDDGWTFTGYNYMNYDGRQSDVHPNLDRVLQSYLEQEAEMIGDYNREVLKEWKDDKLKFD